MMFELNSKPKKLIVQRHTKSNNWLTEAVMYKEDVVDTLANEIAAAEKDTDFENMVRNIHINNRRAWTVEEVYYILEMAQIPGEGTGYGELETQPVRILNEHGKVILSTASHDFLIAAGRSGHITVREPLETVDGKTTYKMECYSTKNTAYPHMREFQRFIGKHKGISHVTKYPRDEKDGWEQIWKVYFKDGSDVTVGTHQLYMLNGMPVSHFAGDTYNV
jgi:hypothetical protein